MHGWTARQLCEVLRSRRAAMWMACGCQSLLQMNRLMHVQGMVSASCMTSINDLGFAVLR
eukprot:2336238-Pleurochrysis_carterae.AAC.1